MKKNYKRRPTSRELNRVVNSFTVYKFIKAITTDFTATDAYRMGVIDERGNYLKNPEGKISVFDRLIINLKVLLNKIPDPSVKAQLKFLTTGIALLAEKNEDPREVKMLIENYIENVLLNESEDVDIGPTGHMTHTSDWAYTPHTITRDEKTGEKIHHVDPMLGIKHTEAVFKSFQGQDTVGHSKSIKADGGTSMLVTRHPITGEILGAYKSGKKFYNKKQLLAMTPDKAPPWRDDMIHFLNHAEKMKIKKGHMFQGDLLWANRGQLTAKGTVQPNTIHYKPTHHSMGIAFHGHFELHPESLSDVGTHFEFSGKPGHMKKFEGVDHSQIEHHDVFSPNLSFRGKKIHHQRAKAIESAIQKAKDAMTPEVAEYAKNIHKNKHFAKFIQEYSNEVVATTGKRSVKSMLGYINKAMSTKKTSKAYMNKPTQAKLSEKSRKALVNNLTSHINENKHLLAGLFKHAQHLAVAKHHILDHTKEEQGSHSIVPTEGHEHEGIASNFHGHSLAKLTREGSDGFSSKNRANSLIRFGQVSEEISAGAMTASSGAVTGVTPGKPEETIVRRRKRVKTLKEMWSKFKQRS